MERARRLLCQLQDHIREILIAARNRGIGKFAEVAGVTSADTIYHVDRISERAVLGWFKSHWPSHWPVELVMEGTADGEAVTFPSGVPVAETRFKCILDPIDGTRNLMYDKRSAWVLTGLALQRGPGTCLADIRVAAMTELPTGKHGRADQLSAIRGGGAKGVRAESIDLRTGRRVRFRPRPSRAVDCRHGFASLVRFFPEGKALTAQIEEELWRELYGTKLSGLVFEDQYISTGGQLFELIIGHDRMVGDIRPPVFSRLRLAATDTCHPYDICTSLILTELGGIVESPDGGPLRAPLDTTSPIAWIGFANPRLARSIRPVLRRLLRRHLG